MRLKTREFNDLAICSLRYALGRRTCITATISELLVIYANDLTENSKEVIRRDILRAFETNDYGMETDKEEWEKVLNATS